MMCIVHNFPHPGHIACCSAPNSRPPATKALHTACGNNTSIVSSSWWWAYECPKHVEQIIIAIKHSVASSWFSSSRLRRGLLWTAEELNLIMLKWRIWWASNNANRWQMGFNSAFKWLRSTVILSSCCGYDATMYNISIKNSYITIYKVKLP